MPYQTVGKEIVRGTICRDRWRTTVTVMCSDRVRLGDDKLFLEIQWRAGREGEEGPGQPEDAAPVVLEFRKRVDSASGSVLFGGSVGEPRKSFPGDVRTILDIFGQSRSAGTEPDVVLDVKIEDEVRASIPLLVGDPAPNVLIKAANGTDDAPEIATIDQEVSLRAVVQPEEPGRFRWLTVAPSLLQIQGPAQQQTVSLMPRGAMTEERSVCVLFTPETPAPSTMAVHKFKRGAEVVVRTQGATPEDLQPLEHSWVYWQVGTTTRTLRTDGNGRLHYVAREGADRNAPWEYATRFGAAINQEARVCYSRGVKPLPERVLNETPTMFVLRTATVPEGAPQPGGVAMAFIALPRTTVRLGRPAELTIWPVLPELPTDAYHTNGLNQGAALWTNPAAAGNLTVNEDGAAPAPGAAVRLRDRGLRIEGEFDDRATGVRIQVLGRDGNAVALRTDINPATATVQQVNATLGAAAGGVKPFEVNVFVHDPANVFGPVQILAQSEGVDPPIVEAFAVTLCGFQIAIVDDFDANPNGQARGPIQGEAQEIVVVDFLLSPQASTQLLSDQTRARRMIRYDIRNSQRVLTAGAAVPPGNRNVLKPHMPLWMAELDMLGLGRDNLTDLMAHKHFVQNTGVVGPPASVNLNIDLSWQLEMTWDGPDINSPAFPAIARHNQVFQYRDAFNGQQSVSLRFRDRGQMINKQNGGDVALGAQGEAPNAFVAAQVAAPFPVANRRAPQVVVSGQNRPWGRQAGAVSAEALIVEFQPRIASGAGAELIRGGDGRLMLTLLNVDSQRISPGLIPGAGAALVAPPAGDPDFRLPWFRVRGTNPAPHADVATLSDALVEEFFNANNARAEVAILPLNVWQDTMRRIFAAENGHDRQFFQHNASRLRFGGRSFGHERGMSLFGPPHGYGFGQLDFVFARGATTDEVWSFVENMRTAVRLTMEEKAQAAHGLMAPHLPAVIDRRTRAVFRREVVRRYNGGREFQWNGADWEINPSLGQWANNANHAEGPNPRLRYPNHVLGTNVQYFTPYPNGAGAATVFPWPIAFAAAQFGPLI